MFKSREKIIDVIFLGILGLFIIFIFFQHFANYAVIRFTNWLAIISVVWLVIYRVWFGWKYKFLLLAILFLGSFELFNFSTTLSYLGIRGVTNIWISPLLLLIFILYVILRSDLIIDLIHYIKANSPENEKKMKDFYYNKFKTMTVAEFEEALKCFDEYPAEAQVSLMKLKTERGL